MSSNTSSNTRLPKTYVRDADNQLVEFNDATFNFEAPITEAAHGNTDESGNSESSFPRVVTYPTTYEQHQFAKRAVKPSPSRWLPNELSLQPQQHPGPTSTDTPDCHKEHDHWCDNCGNLLLIPFGTPFKKDLSKDADEYLTGDHHTTDSQGGPYEMEQPTDNRNLKAKFERNDPKVQVAASQASTEHGDESACDDEHNRNDMDSQMRPNDTQAGDAHLAALKAYMLNLVSTKHIRNREQCLRIYVNALLEANKSHPRKEELDEWVYDILDKYGGGLQGRIRAAELHKLVEQVIGYQYVFPGEEEKNKDNNGSGASVAGPFGGSGQGPRNFNDRDAESRNRSFSNTSRDNAEKQSRGAPNIGRRPEVIPGLEPVPKVARKVPTGRSRKSSARSARNPVLENPSNKAESSFSQQATPKPGEMGQQEVGNLYTGAKEAVAGKSREEEAQKKDVLDEEALNEEAPEVKTSREELVKEDTPIEKAMSELSFEEKVPEVKIRQAQPTRAVTPEYKTPEAPEEPASKEPVPKAPVPKASAPKASAPKKPAPKAPALKEPAPKIYRYRTSKFPPPKATNFNVTYGSNDPETEDMWFTDGDIPEGDMPGIPYRYVPEANAGLALHFSGIPGGWDKHFASQIFSYFGPVTKAPLLVSIGSEITFRWVIMRNKADAVKAMATLHDKDMGDFRLLINKAHIGRTLHLCGNEEIQHEGSLLTTRGQPVRPLTQKEAVQTALAKLSMANSSSGSAAQNEHEQQSEKTFKTTAGTEEDTKPEPDEAGPSQSSSWANIASTADPETKVIELHPRRVLSHPRLSPTDTTNSRTAEPQIEQVRVIFLLNVPASLSLSDVSEAVKEGPLYRIVFGVDEETTQRFCGLIFQKAKDAEEFAQVMKYERLQNLPNRFNFIADCVRGDPYPLDAGLASMDHPTYASRRLTIVKKSFFFQFGESQLRTLCDQMVGKESIQLVWLYNGGNATVVFSDVESAVKVKNELERREKVASDSDRAGECGVPSIWKGLSVSFSKDPCVLPLELKTTMHDLC